MGEEKQRRGLECRIRPILLAGGEYEYFTRDCETADTYYRECRNLEKFEIMPISKL